MLGDTFVLPMSGGDVTLRKINQDGYSSEYLYRNSASEYRVRVRHSKTSAKSGAPAKDRHNVEVTLTTFADGENPEYEAKSYHVFEHVPDDTSVDLALALTTKLAATSGALLVQLLGWES